MKEPPVQDPLLGQRAGSYVVERLIGKGGMGAVYLARHTTLGRVVALKVLLPEYTDRMDLAARFIQEAVSAAHVRGPTGRTHRNVAEPIDTGALPDGRHFIMVEFLEGCDLEQYAAARGGRLDEADVLAILCQAAAALHAAHTAVDASGRSTPIIHRDIKPANLFWTRDDAGRPLLKLLDFGIAKVAAAARTTGVLTGGGMLLGSPAYMAPEQARDAMSVDARADLYALGVVAYELLTGRLPHVADSALGYVLAKQEQTPVPITQLVPTVSPVWDVVVPRLLSWAPADRYADVREVIDDLVDGTDGVPGIRGAHEVLAAAWPTFATDDGPGHPSAPPLRLSPTAPTAFAHGSRARSGFGSRRATTPPRRRWLPFLVIGAAIAVGAVVTVLVAGSAAELNAGTPSPRQPAQPAQPAVRPPPVPPVSVDAGTPDAASDAPVDASTDAPVDASTDAPVDASTDAAASAHAPPPAPVRKPPRRPPPPNRNGIERP